MLDRYGFGPVVEGHDLPHHPFDPTATDLSDDVPVMVGGTSDENALFLAPDDAVWNRTLSEDELKTRVAKVAAGNTDAVLALYRQMHPGMNPAELLIEITTDSNFWVRSVLLAERKAAKRQGARLHVLVQLADPGARRQADGAARDRRAVRLRHRSMTVGITGHSPAAAAIAAAESLTWAAFARAGTPDNKAIPHWPAYTAAERATMMIDTEWRVQNDPQHEARLLWTKIAVA